MAIKFGETKGKAQKGVDDYKYKDGDNLVRLVGDVLPRYVYWLKGANDKDIPVECLAFSREAEKFNNKEVDHVPKYFPEKKCSWAYSMMCIDPTDGKKKPINLKKKLFEQIMTAAEDLGDPTDFVTGWDINFKRVKTGPLAFNVEYTLQSLRCKPRALSPEEVEVASTDVTIDTIYVRPTSDEVKATLERIINGASDEEGTETASAGTAQAEAVKDL